MKKLTRKLFVSIMTLVLTAMALGTSTFAWFSSNSAVQADTMQVTVKANSTFLLIGNTNVLATVQSGSATSIAALTTHPDQIVYPVSYNNTNAAVDVSRVGTTALSVPSHGWYTAKSNNVDHSSGADYRTDAEIVTEGNADYMVTYQVWLTLAGSATVDVQTLTKTLTVSATFSAISGSDYSAVKCVVLIGSPVASESTAGGDALGRFNLYAGNLSATTSSAITVSSDKLIPVTVYVYVDGEEEITKTRTIMGGTKLAGQLVLDFTLAA